VLGRAGPAERERLVAYGAAVGLAFQLADDLLDHEGDAATVGKATAKDAGRGKATLVALIGADAARQRLAATVAAALDMLAPFGDAGRTLAEAARFVAARQS
jgi:farnesyl diphosphate synthase